ncbi:MAG TPA: hypothetical protein VF169_25985 [Albitalea sp.]|uniref:hypothetical protein n=1 Tax=Piscinibacter sp. TaxID=1903157 RepID=UPI002ED10BA6
MRSAHWMVVAAVALNAAASVWAVQGDGLIPPKETPWPRWQGRLSLGTTAAPLRADPMNVDSSSLSGASVLGDYYFTRSLPRLGSSGGFRATSGLFLGSRAATLLSTGPGAGLGGRAFSVDRRSLGGYGLVSPADAPPDSGAVPYVGVGYTGLSPRSGWGFSADLGLMALSPSSAVKLGRVFSGNQSLDDVLRDMRLSPLVQVGVSYSF